LSINSGAKLYLVTAVTIAISVISAAHWLPKKAVAQTAKESPATERGDWPEYGGDRGGTHYSTLRQITRTNVSQLKVAWTFDTKETGGLETTPVIVDGVLYAFTPTRKVIALDGATGTLLWRFDSGVSDRGQARAVSYWSDGNDRRIFAGVGDLLYALDAATGKPIPTFGENGRVDLRKGLGDDYSKQSIRLTSPGAIYHDLIIVGGAEPEEHPAPPGDIRAYDVRTGQLRWTFHTIPHPGEYGYNTWKQGTENAGAANNWAGMSVDVQRGIVYVPTGSAVADFYGGDRVGDDLFADTLLALDAETGKRIWHFQGVHHDLWDRDFPSAPVLLSLNHNGAKVDAVAQTTKSGYVFVFDRVTGEPLFPIQESPYPASTVPGEVASPTQPLPTEPPPFARQRFTREMVTNRTPEAHAWALKQFDRFISNGQFVPSSLDKLTIMLPGMGGGAEWGGPAVDPSTGVMFVNANEMPRLYGLTQPPPPGSPGEKVFQDRCSACHGVSRAGSPPAIPSLIGITGKLSDDEIKAIVHQGRGRMPPFPDLSDEQIQMTINYLKSPPGRPAHNAATAEGPPVQSAGGGAEPQSTSGDMPAFRTVGSLWFLDPDGYPAVVPPWGTLNAIDLNTGKFKWKIPLGEYPELTAKGIVGTGSENYGGPIITSTGVLFIAATVFDQKIRAFNTDNGKLLWEAQLPYSGLATPATYMAHGKQYVAMGCGGGIYSRGPSGGVYVAFALP
jgi:quinoprotein glucose dehydrogenase